MAREIPTYKATNLNESNDSNDFSYVMHDPSKLLQLPAIGSLFKMQDKAWKKETAKNFAASGSDRS